MSIHSPITNVLTINQRGCGLHDVAYQHAQRGKKKEKKEKEKEKKKKKKKKIKKKIASESECDPHNYIKALE